MIVPTSSSQALLQVDEEPLCTKRALLRALQALEASGSSLALLKSATGIRRELQGITGTAQTQFHSESRAFNQVASRIQRAAGSIEREILQEGMATARLISGVLQFPAIVVDAYRGYGNQFAMRGPHLALEVPHHVAGAPARFERL